MADGMKIVNWLIADQEGMLKLLYQGAEALAFVIAGILFRKLFAKYIIKKLYKITTRTKTQLDNHLIAAFKAPLELFIVFGGIYLALASLPLNPDYQSLILGVFRSGLIGLIALGTLNFVSDNSMLAEELSLILGIQVDRILIPFLSKTSKIIVIVLAVIVIAQEWGYDVNGLIAGVGLGGLAFALAAKDTVANMFGGFIVITDKPFSIGDWIETPSIEGTVEDINFRSTKVRTFAQALVTVPNATIANEPVTNWTRMGKRRITFNLGITYSTPRAKIIKCVAEIRTMLVNHEEIHPETIFVRFDKFGPSSLDIFLYFFTLTTNWAEYLRVKEDVNLKIIAILEREAVIIAYPSTSIYLERIHDKLQMIKGEEAANR